MLAYFFHLAGNRLGKDAQVCKIKHAPNTPKVIQVRTLFIIYLYSGTYAYSRFFIWHRCARRYHMILYKRLPILGYKKLCRYSNTYIYIYIYILLDKHASTLLPKVHILDQSGLSSMSVPSDPTMYHTKQCRVQGCFGIW